MNKIRQLLGRKIPICKQPDGRYSVTTLKGFVYDKYENRRQAMVRKRELVERYMAHLAQAQVIIVALGIKTDIFE